MIVIGLALFGAILGGFEPDAAAEKQRISPNTPLPMPSPLRWSACC